MNPDHDTAYQVGYIIGTILGLLLGVGGVVFFIVAVVKAFTRKTKGWIVAAVVMGVLGLFVVGGMMAAAIWGASRAVSADTQLTQVLSSKESPYRISVPASWKPMPELNAEAALAAGHGHRELYLIVLIEEKSTVGVDLSRYMSFTSDRMAGVLRESNLGELTELEISGHSAQRRSVTGRAEGVSLAYLHTCVETDQHLVQLICWTLAGREATAFPIFEKVAATFRANGAPPAPSPEAAK
jgi:hypothetical protein